MALTIQVRGNLRLGDVQRLHDECARLFPPDDEVTLQKESKQIDAGFVVLTSQMVVAVAALLRIYVDVSRMMGEELTYDRLLERIRSVMSEKGVADFEVLDVANFKPKAARRFDAPCIVTLRDRKTQSCYRVFYSGEGNIFTLEIQRAA